ncbi:hypothetical protein Y032_0043g838 [Ancylostoma ceylanicum]|nr:hypothetical protein Y032_0043g838 [Ancylostoma ceylanicum]
MMLIFVISTSNNPLVQNLSEFHEAIDFECTCVEVIYDYPHEIIEFPAVLIDVRQMRIVDTFRTFVRPEKNPTLDPFCIQLTGNFVLTQLLLSA